ncbi:MAG: glycosyltransferase family 2 protein [Acidobacteriota bacterium]
MMKNRISVVIPVYNGEATIGELVRQLGEVLPTVSSAYEAILVDDGSADGSWAAIQDLASRHAWVRGVRLAKNAGQHSALLCGIRKASYEITVTMDDDLQHPPSEIRGLIERLGEGQDVVYGVPEKERHGLWRDLASVVTKAALKSTMGVATARDVGAFRAFRTCVRDAFADYHGAFVNMDVLLTWGTTKFSSARVHREPRRVGRSNYTLRMLIRHTLNMVTGFSTRPLQIASLVGFAFTIFGGFVLAYVLGRYLIQGAAVPGFAFLASIIALFSGAQLFALGIIGEYLARVHFRSMQRPPYVIGAETPDHTVDRDPVTR